MNRQFGHVKILKRSGRGHDPDGVKATSEGACAVICPACPQPGRNLPANWEDAPDKIKYVLYPVCLDLPSLLICSGRWIFALFTSEDANFRMVRKVSNEQVDPSLSRGWAYLCEITKYYEHLAKYGDQPAQV